MKIFLDDERYPAQEGFTICRSILEFSTCILKSPTIEFISFDHDLGNTPDGLQCAKLLVKYDMDHNILTKDFTFYVHSQNPVGKKNIETYLNNYLDFKFGSL